MNKVHVLPPEVISKIAAGEVIERPASVVKELLENALDAKAKSIEIHLKEAGKSLISIKDTGVGMEPDDLEVIFQRHATSKIESMDDLFNIHSLGFRGEALYSICSIADVILRSRVKTQDSGWEIHMRGGKRLNLYPVTMNVGTEIEVQELFFNTPARRKFLKSNTTELNQVIGTVIPYALLYPNVHFTLRHQVRKLLDLKPASNYLERAAETLNVDAKFLLETKQDFPDLGISLHLILGDMNITRPRRDMQFVFINNRPVQNKSIAFHLNEIYRLILPPGLNPFFICYATVPAETIDVNIHPTKREVKIRDEQNLIALLRQMSQTTLLTAGQAKQVTTPKKTKIETGKDEFVIRRLFSETNVSDPHPVDEIPKIMENLTPKSFTLSPTEQYSFPKEEQISFAGEKLTVGARPESLKERLTKARYIGSFINKFLIFEENKSLLIIDQHAAQERITFELLIQQMEKGKIEVQNLLSPYTVKLSPQEFLAWEEAKDKLDTLGFSTNQFGQDTVAINSYPVLLKQPDKAFQDILSGGNVVRCDHETIARRACRCSIMAGDVLNPEQAVFQRDQLVKTHDPFTCPHGRPTLIEIKESFLDKQFLRT